MFYKKLITMILSAFLCPVIICFLSGGIRTVVNGFLSSAVSAAKSVSATEKENNKSEDTKKPIALEDVVSEQEKWFRDNEPTGNNPDNVSDFSFEKYTFEDGIKVEGYTITEYKGSSKEIVIPSEYEGEFVIAIKSDTFSGKDITSVTLPESLLYIDRRAFDSCKYLEDINFPENLQKIDAGAFADCKSLSTLTLGKNIRYIGEYAFKRCDTLKSVQITGGERPLILDQYCFNECKSLEKVTIPDYTDKLCKGVFSNCKALTDFTLTETGKGTGITTDRWVFEYCEKLTSFDASKFLNIESGVFQGCTSLETVILPETQDSIKHSTFLDCVSLKDITLPEGVTVIEEDAFYGCTSLTAISLPASVTSIGETAFKETNITEIFIPSNVSYIGRSAFLNCTNLKKIEFEEEGERLTIYYSAFENTGIEELTLPGRVVTVGNQSFVSCANLKKVVYKSSGAAFADQNIEFKAFAGTPLEEIHIPETVGIIGEYAIPKSATIYCAPGSSAEEWAKYEVKYVTE